MKRLSFFFMFASIIVTSLTLASCGDDDNEDITTAKNAVAQSYAGTYSGTDNLNVNMTAVSWDYTTASSVLYRITANNDGSINVTVPDETYSNTQIGNIEIGSYTIDSLKYNVLTGYTRAYKGSNARVHFQATGSTFTYGGQEITVRPINDNYSFTSDLCVISVSRQTDGSISIRNAYKLGNSPVVITHTFNGTKGYYN